MATTAYTIVDPTCAPVLSHGDSFVLVPHLPSEALATVEIENCSGTYPLVRWRDREAGFVPVGVGFLQTDVPVLIAWDATNARWNVAAQALTINDREWLHVVTDATVAAGNARLYSDKSGVMDQYWDLTSGRVNSSVVMHSARSGGAIVTCRFVGNGVRVLNKGVLYTSDIPIPAGGTLELVCIADDEYSVVSFSQGTGAQGPAGDTGPAGADSTVPGPKGDTGDTGSDGRDGQIRFTGSGPPATIVGSSPNDTYLDFNSGDVYKLT